MCPNRKSRTFSTAADRSLDFGDFRAAVRSLLVEGEEPTDEQLRELFDHFDKATILFSFFLPFNGRLLQDGDGRLNENEAARFHELVVRKVRELRVAFVVVDFQNDFIDGSMGLKYGEAKQDPTEVIEPINELLDRHSAFHLVVYSLDWHPEDHISFYEHARNADRLLSEADRSRVLKPFDLVRFERPDCEQVLYPPHCVQNTKGAALHKKLRVVEGGRRVFKGTDRFVDSYSAFMNNRGEISTPLNEILIDEEIDAIFVCGLALDICVFSTARDGARLGFLSSIVEDCSRGLSEAQIERTRRELAERNVPYVSRRQVGEFLDERRVHFAWVRELAKRAADDLPTIPVRSAGAEEEKAVEQAEEPNGTTAHSNGVPRPQPRRRIAAMSPPAICFS
ncbi:Isochorismatase domain-containing protein [Aphelenchoides fujianensis]|nr:Isochorismatase domain-containing protein [Aphelenchoides fujianensis]